MFDEIRVDYEHELGFWSKWPLCWQTKDLECALSKYNISKDGILYKDGNVVNHNGVIQFYNNLPINLLLEDISNPAIKLNKVHEYLIKNKESIRERHLWIEYAATFKNGKLINLKLLHY